MRTLVATGALVGIIGAGLVSGCSASGGGGGASGDNYAQHGVAGVVAGAGSSAASAPASGALSQRSATTTDDIVSRALIRIASLKVAVKSGTVADRADQAGDIATAAGGVVYADERSAGSAESATAALTLKVPPDSLETTLAKLSALGTEKSRDVSTQDVTGQVADVASRVASARDSITRLRALYANAVKVKDVISIESELATREASLESLEAQQHSLATQTATATVHLSLVALAAPVAKHHTPPGRHGVGGALASGWDAFTAATSAVTRALAAGLPFIGVAALLASVGFLAWRRRATTPAEPVADPS